MNYLILKLNLSKLKNNATTVYDLNLLKFLNRLAIIYQVKHTVSKLFNKT